MLAGVLVLGAVGAVAAYVVLRPYAGSRVDDTLLQIARSGGTSRLYAYDFTDRAAREGEAYELGVLCGGSTPLRTSAFGSTGAWIFCARARRRWHT